VCGNEIILMKIMCNNDNDNINDINIINDNIINNNENNNENIINEVLKWYYY